MTVHAPIAPTGWAEVVIVILLLGVLPAANLYPLFYAFRPWRSTPQGRALMVKAISNVILLDMAAAVLVFGDYAGRETVRVAGFALLFLGINYLFVSLLTAPGAEDYPPRSWRRKRR